MESAKNNGLIYRYALIAAVLLLMVGGTGSNVAHGRSIYIIGSITNYYGPLPIFAYDIALDGTLTLQTEQSIPFRDGGAVGIAVDWQSGYIFITYEFSGFLQLLDARTMAEVGKASAAEAENLAGIKFDESKGLLYCVDRGTDKLYSYGWYPQTGKLIPVEGSPFTLMDSASYGIELDEERGLLYTASGTKNIRVYDTDDWSSVETITIKRPAISLALDVFNQLLYTGAGYLSDTTLNQYNLATGQTNSVTVDPVAGVMGLAVDSVTGCVYVTTGLSNRPGGDDLLVYDRSLNLIDSVLNIGNPTGIVVPARELGYNPLNFRKEIATDDDADSDDDIYVSIGDTLTYQLCFDNANTVREVSIVDSLPAEVTFMSADGDGDTGRYDATTHTYTWSIPSVAAGSSTCLSLTVKVNEQVPAGTLLRNHATIRTRTVPPTTVSADVIVKGGIYEPLALTKEVVGGVLHEDGQAYANAGDVVSYTIRYSNEDNSFPVTGVSLVDTLPKTMTFMGVEGNPAGGAYDPVDHSYTCTWSSLAPGTTGSIKLTAQINDDATPGSIITNIATIDCNETAPTTTTADVVIQATELKPLNLVKEIIAGATEPDGDGRRYVGIGDEITYRLCFGNSDNERAVSAVSIIDFLPSEVTFVRAEGDGDFGRYDTASHSYVWSVDTLAPDETICVELVVQVRDDTPAGTVILNRATIDSDQTEATVTNIEVTVNPIVYKPLGLAKEITAGATVGKDDKTQYIGIGDNVTYEICFDSNDNDYRIHGLMVTDTLPTELAFVSADGDGVFGSYDTDRHVYTWSYPSLLPGSGACLKLTAQLREDTVAGTTVTNSVTIDSDDTEPQTASVSAVAEKRQIKPFDLTKTVTAGVTGQDEQGVLYVARGEELTYTLCMTNNNDLAMRNVVVTDVLPAEVAFVSADADGVFGRYDPETHTYTWSYPTFEPTAQVCIDLTVRVNDDVEPGATIKNQVSLDAEDTTTETDAEVVVELEPLVLTKTAYAINDAGTLVGPVKSASPGDELVYEIQFENDQDVRLHDIVIVDILPPGVVFVGAEGDAGYYDPEAHTYTWTYPALKAGAAEILRLTVRLRYDLQSGDVLRNTVTLDSSETPIADTDTDVNVIIDEAPLEVGVTITPMILGREGYNRSDRITAVLQFPEEITESDIGKEALQLDPGNVAPDTQTVAVKDGRIQVSATFNLFDVLDAIDADGITTLYVGGKLQSGRAFFGQGNVLVVAVRPF